MERSKRFWVHIATERKFKIEMLTKEVERLEAKVASKIAINDRLQQEVHVEREHRQRLMGTINRMRNLKSAELKAATDYAAENARLRRMLEVLGGDE